MTTLVETAAIIILPILLCVFAYRKNLMTQGGAVTAFVLAEVIGFSTGIWWEIPFFLFPIIAFVATKWKIKEKVRLGLQEGRKGERSTLNILGVGLIPTIIALVQFLTGSEGPYLAVAFLSALAVSCSDTVASETGMWAKKTYMITTLKQIEPGPNGGVSAYGFATSFLGALAFALVSYLIVFHDDPLGLGTLRFLVIAVAGMVGNVMDSILGALLENRGYISKYTNNASTSLIGAIVGFILFLAF
ncbi:MAG: DUF92 domain-containing protein [archaeon]|nr:DUF92 domain-containing protein [archaeon]